MLNQTNDLRYLIVDVDVDELPEIEITNEFQEAYIKIVGNHKEIDTSLQVAYSKALESAINYIDKVNSKNEQRCNDSFHDYLNDLNNKYKNFVYKYETFETALDLYNYVKTQFSWKEFVLKRVLIFNYNELTYENKTSWDLFEEAAVLESTLKITIDTYVCPTNKYFGYQTRAMKMQNK
jgi:hypothetical protein